MKKTRQDVIDFLRTFWLGHRSSSFRRGNYLFALCENGQGHFLVWGDRPGASVLTREVFGEIVREARALGVARPYHIYASRRLYFGPGIKFHHIPHAVLRKVA
ncbi:hypothetical protein [Geoalkalibacter subterraneus]|uniref:Uncharacterized protein n=1 Tax=Geoalkalibacter subterraneus TaxID=483547 RepID=A0A0B5FVL7_9BACT|nr:hypothetical protein [Geoalkalibacter subterraneus]AJF08210.1 hypothetical protein GSUB_17120 [Geoalkalibacter subterraneus]